MHDFTVWVSYGKWRKNWDIRYCLLHLIHLSSIRLRRCGRILSGICEPYCLITPDLTMRYCPILILIDYKCGPNLSKNFSNTNPSTPAWQTMAGIFLYRLPSFVYLATFSLQMTAIEQSFGTLHRKFRYARAAYFGLIKVSAQSHLKVMCLNLLKAANRLSVPVAA